MINVGRITNSRNFAQPGGFTVYRQSGSWVAGRWESSETVLQLEGTVTPAGSKDLLQVPEGDRVTGVMMFFSVEPIYTTRAAGAETGTSDEIVWRGDRYRVASIGPWADFGFYQAFGVRKESD